VPALAESGTSTATAAQRGAFSIALAQEGALWRITTGTASFHLPDGKGLRYFDHLVRNAGAEVHVSQLVGVEETAGDAGPILDAKAKQAYRRWLEDLGCDLEEARRSGDATRAAFAQREIDAIAAQLAMAVGLGGRDRKAASRVERDRINVQRRLRDAVERLREQDAPLARWVEASLKTGTYCSFTPL
jgi:hypothetical protein